MSRFILLQNELLFQSLSLLGVHMSLFWSPVIYVDSGSELEATVGNDDLFMLTVWRSVLLDLVWKIKFVSIIF